VKAIVTIVVLGRGRGRRDLSVCPSRGVGGPRRARELRLRRAENGKGQIFIEFHEDMVKSDRRPATPTGPSTGRPGRPGTSRCATGRTDGGRGPRGQQPVASGSPRLAGVGFATLPLRSARPIRSSIFPSPRQPKRYTLKATAPKTKAFAQQVYFLPVEGGGGGGVAERPIAPRRKCGESDVVGLSQSSARRPTARRGLRRSTPLRVRLAPGRAGPRRAYWRTATGASRSRTPMTSATARAWEGVKESMRSGPV